MNPSPQPDREGEKKKLKKFFFFFFNLQPVMSNIERNPVSRIKGKKTPHQGNTVTSPIHEIY